MIAVRTPSQLPDVEHSSFRVIHDTRDAEQKQQDRRHSRQVTTAQQRIDVLRADALALVDEVLDLESRLPFPPEPICPGCQRVMP